MYEQAVSESEEGNQSKNKEDKSRVSIYEALQVLIEHGHDKDKVLNTYSRNELSLFYEKCMRLDTLKDARTIENLACGIGLAFGGGKEIKKMLQEMRK